MRMQPRDLLYSIERQATLRTTAAVVMGSRAISVLCSTDSFRASGIVELAI